MAATDLAQALTAVARDQQSSPAERFSAEQALSSLNSGGALPKLNPSVQQKVESFSPQAKNDLMVVMSGPRVGAASPTSYAGPQQPTAEPGSMGPPALQGPPALAAAPNLSSAVAEPPAPKPAAPGPDLGSAMAPSVAPAPAAPAHAAPLAAAPLAATPEPEEATEPPPAAAPEPEPSDEDAGGGSAGPGPTQGEGSGVDSDAASATTAAAYQGGSFSAQRLAEQGDRVNEAMDRATQAATNGDAESYKIAAGNVHAALVDETVGPNLAVKAIAKLTPPTGDVDLSPREIKNYEDDKRFLQQEFREARSRLDWSEVAELVGNALIRFGAAQAGLAQGVDLSHIDTVKQDWEKKRALALEDFKTAMDIKWREHQARKQDVQHNQARKDSYEGKVTSLTMEGGRMKAAAQTHNAGAKQAANADNARLQQQAAQFNAETGLRFDEHQVDWLFKVTGEEGANFRAMLKANSDAEKAKLAKADKTRAKADSAAAKLEKDETTAGAQAAKSNEALHEKSKADKDKKLAAYDEASGLFLQWAEAPAAKRGELLAKAKDKFGEAGVKAETVNRWVEAANKETIFGGRAGANPDVAKTQAESGRKEVESAPVRDTPTIYRFTDGTGQTHELPVKPSEKDEFLSRFPTAKPVVSMKPTK